MSQQKEKNQNKLKGTQELYQFAEMKTMKPFEELTFSDSFLFGEVMMDENTCRNVLDHYYEA